MRLSITFIALASAAATATAQSGNGTPGKAKPPETTSEPCAIVSSRAASYISDEPTVSAAILRPSEVYAYLRSVPYDQDRGTRQIAWMKDVCQSQSTLAYLSNPPSTYPLPAVDIIGGLDNISTSITGGKYTNEYHIELALYNLIDSAYDSHFCYVPYLLGLFSYSRGFSLVSVSENGIDLQKLYVLSDVAALSNLSNVTFDFSAVISINDQDVKDLTQYDSGFQDLDAMYNNVLDTPATTDGTLGAFLGRYFTRPGDTTSLKFENGSYTQSTLQLQLIGLSTISISSSAILSTIPTASASPSPLPSIYTSPIVRHSQNINSDYFLNGTEDFDVAVLSVNSFDTDSDSGDAGDPEFLETSLQFLGNCKSAGKCKLIVDVRNNSGGDIPLAYKLLQLLFPDIVPYSQIRFRTSDAAKALGQIGSSTSVQNDPQADLRDNSGGFAFAYQKFLERHDGSNFTSWQQLYGPVPQNNDLFSNTFAWGWSTTNLSAGPSRRIIHLKCLTLTDGQCASTCANFADLMIKQGLVGTVAVGGRPNKRPMAVVGGVQGRQVLPIEDLRRQAKDALAAQANATGVSSELDFTLELLGSLASPSPIAYSPGDGSVAINLLDNIAENDTTFTPLKFLGGIAANRRMFYVAADLTSVANTWARVAAGVRTGGSGLCVNGNLSKTPITTTGPVKTIANSTTADQGGNGTSAVPFLGSASIVCPSHLAWSVFLVTLGYWLL